MKRCKWAAHSPSEQKYHDEEWGTPLHNDQLLFEFLILEGAQAGLSWSTILNKRDGYRKAFKNFEAEKIAKFSKKTIDKLLLNPDIVRNKLKINSTINNAKAFLDIQQEFNTFDAYIWQFSNGEPIQNNWADASHVPVNTPESDIMAKDLKKRGFTFVGTTICYAYMQAIGMVNDHTVDCFRYQIVKQLGSR